MLEEDSLLNFNNFMTNNPEDMSFSKSLESEELEVIGLREKKLLKELEEVKKKRLEAIANTETKTEKLQMMKKYYTLEIENQE